MSLTLWLAIAGVKTNMLPSRSSLTSMSASGTLPKTIAFLSEIRFVETGQENWDLLPHGRQRGSRVADNRKTFSATVAEACPSTKKLRVGFPNDCRQVRSCSAGSKHPPRRAVRKPTNHAKPCQTQHRTPANREIAVAAAHAEGKNAVQTTTTPKIAKAMANAMKAAASALGASNKAASPRNAECRLHQS